MTPIASPCASARYRSGAYEHEREGADELREGDGSFEGSRLGPFPPTYNLSTAERKAAMSAEILKRKLRNFPVASLSQRITAIA
jgi:hypothetical protein